jgi:glycosidase
MSTAPGPWWRGAVFSQVYIRSFADSDGDGIGDLPGITSRLLYLRDLGVDAVWITPFYPSPQRDAGYDVADYCDVDRRFGRLADVDALLTRAHDLGLRVVVDLVPNHTSSEHGWFHLALARGPGSPERARYLFRTGRGRGGQQPPNNWQSVFGGPAWTRVADGEWYLHLFDTSQPDLDWRNPDVRAMFEEVLRFWLDRGVDGFRVDVAHGLLKEPGLRDQRGVRTGQTDLPADRQARSRDGAAGPARTTPRCGTSPRCTRCTAPGGGSSTPTTATGWPWPRPGRTPRRRPRATCARRAPPDLQLRVAARALVGRGSPT